MSDEYNGWTNRETWAVNLHLSNDEGLYNMTLERVAALDEPDARDAGEAIQALVDDLFDEFGDVPGIAMMRDEVGSMWRVDWDEVGAAWLDGDA